MTRSRFSPGARLGDYRFLELLGRGAMGSVFRVREESTGRTIALKLLERGGAPAVRAARFEREASITASLRHPGIIGVHSAGEIEGVAYIAYELVEQARTLDEAWRTLPVEGRVRLVRDAARAVGVAHARGIVHRDLKPANILVDREGRVRVADFGIANMVGLERLTITNQIVGTPSHMAPEQVTGGGLSPASDVWALGVLLYEALTNEEPYMASGFVELISTIVSTDPKPPRKFVGVSSHFDAVCMKALSKAPDRRYPSGEALAQALDEALEPSVSRSSLPLGGGLLVVGVLVAGGVFLSSTASRTTSVSQSDVAVVDSSANTGSSDSEGDSGSDVRKPDALRAPSSPHSKAFTPFVTVDKASEADLERLRRLLPARVRSEPEYITAMRVRALDGILADVTELARCYIRGDPVPKDMAAGVRLLEFAAELGDPRAMVHFGDLLRIGLGTPVDVPRAMSLYEQAAPINSKALARLGAIYAQTDTKRALEIFQRSLAVSDSGVFIHLGTLYSKDDPKGVRYDAGQSVHYLLRAIGQGNDAALGYQILEDVLRKEQKAGRRIQEADDWISAQVRSGSREANVFLQRLVFDPLLVKRYPIPEVGGLLRLWGTDPRPLDPSLELRLNGEILTETTQSPSFKRWFTANARLVHIWYVGDGGAKTVYDFHFDCLEHLTVEATYSPNAKRPMRAVSVGAITSPPGFYAYVGEDEEGRLSNPVFMRVTE